MPDDQIEEQLRAENEDLRQRLEVAEATLDAIRKGEVDALVVAGAHGHRIYTLEGADQFYRVLIEAMQPGQGAASLSADGTILYCNRSLAALLGTPQEKVAGQSFQRFVSTADIPRWQVMLREAQSAQHQGELQLQPTGKRPFPVHLALNSLPLTGAVALGLVITDLTERKRQEETVRLLAHEEAARAVAESNASQARQSEASIRQSEARFRQLANALPQIVWMARPDGFIDYFNERWYEYTGFSRDHFGDASWTPVLHADDLQRCLALYYGCIHTGDLFQIEYRLKDRHTAGHRWFLGRAYPVRDERNRIVRWFGTCTDIDDLKKASERQRLLGEAAALLLTSNEPDSMMHTLFSRIAPPLGLDTYFNFMVDETGEALRLLSCVGIPEDVARSISRLEFGQAICGTVALHQRAIVATGIQSSSDPKTQLVKSFGIKTYACNPLLIGERLLGTLSFASRSKERFDEDELEFLRTVTRYVTVAHERLRLVEQLREKDRRKDDFLATLAHELRNPLAPVRNAAHFIKLRGSTDPSIQNARDIIERQLGHLTRLVDDLLDVSRITRGKITIQRERIGLGVILANAIEASRPTIDANGHELFVSLPPDQMFLEGDLTRLVQVFGNILVNAAKYTDRGGCIWLTARREAGDVVVSVKDTGIGIPRAHLPRVFDMFSQVDSALERTQGGLGIGLSLVKGIVEMHNGSVDVVSEGLGKGSEFLVRLPLLVEAPTGISNGADEKTATLATNRRRILVADDNVDSAESLAMLLSLMGHDVAVVHDGCAAVALAAEYHPEVILLDIGMPKMNGYEAARRIRAQVWSQSVVLVALTGWGQEDDKRKASEAGFDHHFTKPVATESLEALLADTSPPSAKHSSKAISSRA